MSKRKRLTAANPEYREEPLETKAYFMGVAPTQTRRAPVAQVAGDSSLVAALEEVSETLRRAREDGRMVLSLSLDAIETDYLVRDRIRVDDDELNTLCASIAARGQQMPIEVAALPGDRYGLISGWRRLTALKRLAAERPDAGFDTVLALLRRPEDSAESYLAMVEENEIRVGLSHYERARIAARAVDMNVFEDTGVALRSLYANASRAKRSKIGSFLRLVSALDTVLRFPEDIGERLGLKLSTALEEDPRRGPRLARDLQEADARDPQAEKACLERFLKRLKTAEAPPAAPREEPRKGVFMQHDGKDRLVLSGPGVTPDFIDALRRHLQDSD
ncbi:Nucleoid occlusion protein (plasmid) [Roseovarius sp. THAF27]|uniref:ParB/RepB/Spo0J family partition protein n=1 Tax=unclassified Roseovarius TaxID=2614913 RepID=UPI001267B5B7|nr:MULTISPECIES: ParB N-terminal domain-containing protein [unclassified Roseovarius]QFT83286.1 Nucleoid occlusion protein [Roseovarius sp. THAF27]QFT99952.1 Nucleoid occlusion protein [Roseovarius sp. THAF8]